MKKIRETASLLLFVSFLLLSAACTKDFREINTDKSGITDEEMKMDYNHLGIPLNIIQQAIYFNYDFGKGKNWAYQIMQNLSADMFCGYMHDYKPFNGGSSNSDYNLQDGWNGTFWSNTYGYTLPEINKLENLSREEHPVFFGIAKVLKVEAMHRVSDYYGPIVYTRFGKKDVDYLPDTQQEAYYAFFNDLDSAVTILSRYAKEIPETADPEKFDIFLDGRSETWIKFANSLRLRLAIRLAVADPEKARQEFLKGMENPFGVFEKETERVEISPRNGYTNPLGEINRVWGEAYMNASMESILNGYEDPRRERFFEPCKEDVELKGDSDGTPAVIVRLKGKYKGIRQGTCFAHTLYSSHSKIYLDSSSPAILLTAAEVWFLRAEAGLRGWTAENPADCYRQGITTSFNQWGAAGIDTYLQSDKTAADYVDAFDPAYTIAARCLVSPRWNEKASKEEKLEKIITQKWLALFPEGCEAWAEQRRTGYPRLFPVQVNNSKGGCIDTEIMIRRLNFPSDMADMDTGMYQALTVAFGKPDHAGSRLWWDTGRNF